MADEGLKGLLKTINKRYGNDCMVQASQSSRLMAKKRIETGILAFDVTIGGGVPVGTIITLKGEFSSGKSALAHRIGAAFQRHCRNCGQAMTTWLEQFQDGAQVACCDKPEPMRVVWLDAEGSYQTPWAERLGMLSDHTYVIRPDFAEQSIDIADMAIRSGECDLLVVDSVAALTPSAEIEESTEKWQQGLQARLMNKAMRKWVSAQNAVGQERAVTPTIILINQIRLKVGIVYGNPETSPGGKGIDFASSVICKVKRKGFIETKEGGAPFGQDIEVVFQKNKTAPPNRSCLFSIFFRDNGTYSAGATNVGEQMLAIAEYWGIVKRAGAWYIFDEETKKQGAAAAAEYILSHEVVYESLKAKILENEVSWLSEVQS